MHKHADACTHLVAAVAHSCLFHCFLQCYWVLKQWQQLNLLYRETITKQQTTLKTL